MFAFADDYAMGVLTSRVHGEWARMLSTLREDIRYTPTTSFETFPWPQPDAAGRDEIGHLAAALIARRREVCTAEGIGLTTLYNRVEEGAWRDVRDLHRALDDAVAAAYGWPREAAHDPEDSNSRLLELNREIAAERRPYAPFAHLEAA